MMAFMQPLHPETSRDYVFLWALCILLGVGSLALSSASMEFAANRYDNTFYFVQRHMAYLVISIGAAVAMLCVPMQVLEKHGWMLLLLGFGLLVAVLIYL